VRQRLAHIHASPLRSAVRWQLRDS
jgi:hypothetical protein